MIPSGPIHPAPRLPALPVPDGSRRRSVALLLGALLGFGAWAKGEETPSPEPSRASIAAQALLRLEATDLSANAKLDETVHKILGRVRGTPDFVSLVRHFHLTDQGEGLVEVAAARGGDDSGAEAMRILLAGGAVAPLTRELAGTNAMAASHLVQAIGAAGEARGVPVLLPLVLDLKRDSTLRKLAVKALARTSEGAGSLLKLATEDRLPADLRFGAGAELSVVRWPEIRTAAARLFPAPEVAGGKPLPPVAELIRRKGDPSRGAALFSGKATCSTCHAVRGQGVNFGPDLSQVGTKLGKDALYEAILDPSAGISFGFEAWLVTLRNGDEAFGLIASETETDLSIKAPGGIVLSYKKSDIATRTKQALSIMPAGLAALMTPEELTDLVEYLSGLK